MATINKLMVGESLVGEGNEVAHIDLIIGPRGSAAETAFATCADQQQGRLHRAARGGGAEPAGEAEHDPVQQGDDQGRQAGGADVRPGPARGRDGGCRCVADGTIPADEADDLFICVGVFIHWDAADDKKIQDYQLQGDQGIDRARAVKGTPKAAEVQQKYKTAKHPFAAG